MEKGGFPARERGIFRWELSAEGNEEDHGRMASVACLIRDLEWHV
jgi:hypothetical protein